MNVTTTFAKLAGIRKAVSTFIDTEDSRVRAHGQGRLIANFPPSLIAHHFRQASDHLEHLRTALPDLYGDFQAISPDPRVEMADKSMYFGRTQVEGLIRDIDQIFEIRANSELQPPAQRSIRKVFITHGRAPDWHVVQAHIEHDLHLQTLELAQEPNLGRTVIEKLLDAADGCDSAVIVMTGDDMNAKGDPQVRENVMHEIGYFQGRYGRGRVILLHEEEVNVPSNLAGVVYAPFSQGRIEACLHLVSRELRAMYSLG
jgi:predicted nucleotide-binding protein